MSEFDPETEIEALVEAYASGFDDYDPEAVAACFAYPAVIWQAGKGHVFANPDEMVENVSALLKVYEEAGIVLSSFEVGELFVTGDAALATVEWEQENADGVVLMDFTCHYQLVFDGRMWRIAMIMNVQGDDDEAEDDDL